MNKYKYKKVPIFALSVSVIITSVCYGAWIFPTFNQRKDDIITKPSTPVCYIGNKKYMTLDAALTAAYSDKNANTIYVYPDLGFDVTINDNHTINSNDKLILPYEGTNYLSEKGTSAYGFADQNPTQYCKTRVVLASKKTLTINGEFTIGGINGSGGPQGQASESYCELLMEDASQLEVNGKLNCYGYIKENGTTKIHLNSGANLETPIVIYDYGSARGLLNIKNNGVFPFKKFDVPSLRPEMVFEYGSKLIGRVHTYGTNAGHITTTATLITTSSESDGFIKMDNGAQLTWKFNDISSEKTSNELVNHKTKVKLYGQNYFGNLSVTIKYVPDPINSSNYYLPIPYGFSVFINEGSQCEIPSSVKGVKFMPGSNLTCESGGTIKFNSNTLFYQNNVAADGSSFAYESKNAANFINNGSAEINAGFEGVISTDESKKADANLTFGAGYSSVTDSKEGTSESVYTWGGAFGLIDENDTVIKKQFRSKAKYSSIANTSHWNMTWHEVVDIKEVNIISNRTESDPNTEGDFTLKASIEPNPNDSSNISYEWSVEGNSTGLTLPLNLKTDEIQVKTAANSGDNNIIYKLKVIVKFTKYNGETAEVSKTIEFTAKKPSSSCILPNVMVLLPNGTYRLAGQLKAGDTVMSFNHETGKLEPSIVIVNDHRHSETIMRTVVHLEFDNNKSTDFIYHHGYFDINLNKYVYLHEYDVQDYIGHEFVFVENNRFKRAKLINYKIKEICTSLAAPVTANNLNIIVDDMLTIEGGITGLFNIFEYDRETLAFNKAKMQADIDKYGLLDYSYFEKYFPRELYDLLPLKYLGISIAKGLVTWEIIEKYISRWHDQLMENVD